MPPQISIIVPVYNTGETIRASLQSALSQTLSNIEVICIDNNSTDNSSEIIKKIQKTDPRVKLLYEKKQGAGPARNKGLGEAAGEYVFFLDPDDSIYEKNTLKKLYDLAQKHKMKIVGGSMIGFDEKTKKEHKGEDKFYFKKDGIIEYKDYQFDWGFWRFIYKRQFLEDKDIKFPSYLRGEDPVFFVKAMIKAEKFYAIKEPTYKYSYTFSAKKHSPKTYEDYEKANKEVIKMARQNNLKELEKISQSHRSALVSIIIPVYNTSKKDLIRCFDSIKNQTYQHIEVVIVNDGSSQDTADLIDRYTKNTKWRVIHQKNRGLSAARNRGYDIAAGKYIQFLDSDDYFDSRLIQAAVSLAEKSKAEIVIENFTVYSAKFNVSIEIIDPSLFPKNKTFSLLDMGPNKIGTVPYNVWAKLFRKDLLDKHNIRHDEELFRAEDVLFSYTALVLAEKITLLPESYITYIEDAPNSNSVTNDKHRTDSIKSWRKLHDLLVRTKKYDLYEDSFGPAALASIYWTLERLYTTEGIKELGLSTEEFINDMNISSDSDEALLIRIASYSPEAFLLYKQKNKQIRELHAYLDSANVELANYLGLKSSIRLVLGNIKRRIYRLVR